MAIKPLVVDKDMLIAFPSRSVAAEEVYVHGAGTVLPHMTTVGITRFVGGAVWNSGGMFSTTTLIVIVFVMVPSLCLV
jgi:hypothetical protein